MFLFAFLSFVNNFQVGILNWNLRDNILRNKYISCKLNNTLFRDTYIYGKNDHEKERKEEKKNGGRGSGYPGMGVRDRSRAHRGL